MAEAKAFKMIPHCNKDTITYEMDELVRCKDCKWWHESETEERFGDCGQANGITMKPSNWFCADGKRKGT